MASSEKSSEYSYNHVDRVRVGKNSGYNRDCPNRGSGWRQKSISHSDLVASKASNNNFTNLRSSRSLDWNNNTDIQDFLSQIEPEKDYDDYYTESYENKQKAEYYNNYDIGNESCSLRRTRSLAVIREETFNDLQISNGNARRSQLIPRAKLVNRSFFRRRYHQKQRLEEDSAGSGVETQTSQTSETRESDDYYSNLKRLDSVKIVQPAWQNDKSDLESLNSDYFKNSLHQTQQEEQKHRQYQQKRDKIPHSGNRYQVVTTEVHQDNSQSSAFPETTPSTSDQSDTSSDQLEEEDIKKEIVFEDQQLEEFEEVHLEDVIKIGINETPTPSGTLTLKQDSSEVPKPFIAYDSVYLSSEESSEGTVIEEAFNEELNGVVSTINSECASLLQISIEDNFDAGIVKEESPKEEPEIIYTEVKKTNSTVDSTNPPSSKPKILSVERKLKTLSDYAKTTKRGVLEHLTYISTSQVLKGNEVAIIDSFRSNLTENQYYSLPDINIGRSLKVSERIDAKLRSTYNLRHSEHIESYLTTDQTAIFDSINKFGQAHKRARQREYSEVDSLIKDNTPNNVTGVEEILEQPREAPTVEVKAECKEKQQVNDEDSLGESESQSAEEKEIPIVLAPLELTSAEDQQSKEKAKSVEDENKLDLSNFHINQTSNNFPEQFRIIVTDVQNNIIEEDSIESNTTPTIEENFVENINQETITSKHKSKECSAQTIFSKIDTKNTASTTVLQSTKKPSGKILKNNSEENIERNTKISRRHIKACVKTTTSIFKAHPVTVCSNEVKNTDTKMSRPQILHVIDSKRSHNPGKQEGDNEAKDDKVEKEFLEKVDAVRCYWSKLIQNGKRPEDDDESQDIGERNFVTNVVKEEPSEKTNKFPIVQTTEDLNELHSFTPTVEIVELDGQKQATIVKAHDTDNPDFDHVRYKVMKSNLFRNNLLTRSKKEAQFDGLMQYLQDYSFQELLTNNNVVIIEPVRTKIEQPSSLGDLKPPPVNCKITGGSGIDSKSNSNSKRHFFYHPVRVNRELLEDELPTPDTVRNVRKLFEENNIRPKKPQSKMQKTTLDNSTTSTTNGSHKRRSLRYLTIDTSYGGLRKWDSASLSSGISSGDLSSPCECNDGGDHHHHHQDSERVHVQTHPGPEGEMLFSSEENLCDDELCESYYVSEDVLEKIRECGSTVTYYGGRVVDNKSPELSPMTKNIIQEIKGKGSKFNAAACQTKSCLQHNELEKNLSCKGLGVKFKLVKSNSCSSRLELVGTEKLNESGISQEIPPERQHRGSSPPIEPEESVRELVSRLESGAASKAPVPRIIESQCIEKTHKNPSGSSADAVTINNHLINETVELVDVLKQVTVNNHMSFCPSASNSKSLPATTGLDLNDTHVSSSEKKLQQKVNNKVCRNKNVDLALNMTKGHSEKVKPSSKDRENDSRRTPIVPGSFDIAINKSESRKEATGAAQATPPPSELRKPATPLSSTMTMKCEISAKTVDTRKGSGDQYDGVQKAILNANKIENNKFQLESRGNLTTGFQSEILDKQQTSSSQNEKDSLRENTRGHHATNEEKKINSHRSSKVEVTTVDKSFVKHYVANDRKLVETRKYDDIEFEEFEIYDPAAVTSEGRNTSTSTNGTSDECYDSLDGKI